MILETASGPGQVLEPMTRRNGILWEEMKRKSTIIIVLRSLNSCTVLDDKNLKK